MSNLPRMLVSVDVGAGWYPGARLTLGDCSGLAEGVAAAILERLGVTVQAIQTSAARLFGLTPQSSGDGPPALSAEAVCTMEAAAHHAQATATNPDRVEVGSEHLLLVLALDPGSRARRVLLDLGTDIAVIKKELACHLTVNPRRTGRLGRRRRTGPACSFCGTAEHRPSRWSTARGWRSAAAAPPAPLRLCSSGSPDQQTAGCYSSSGPMP